MAQILTNIVVRRNCGLCKVHSKRTTTCVKFIALYNILFFLFSGEKWCLPTTIMTRPTRFKFNRGKALSDLFHAYIISRWQKWLIRAFSHQVWHCDIFATSAKCVNISLRSVVGLVIQATGRTEFEDGLRPGSPGGVLSDNPSVRTSSLVTPVL